MARIGLLGRWTVIADITPVGTQRAVGIEKFQQRVINMFAEFLDYFAFEIGCSTSNTQRPPPLLRLRNGLPLFVRLNPSNPIFGQREGVLGSSFQKSQSYCKLWAFCLRFLVLPLM
jgi:hypothetical protein